MANFHLSLTILSRRRGRSSVAAAAYRSASVLLDRRRERRYDFTAKQAEVAYSCILYPDSEPVGWTREELWNAAERAEKRQDSVVARELNIAFVRELPVEDQIPLVKKLAKEIAGRHRIAADLNVHVPSPRKGQRRRFEPNPHVHLQLTTRRIVDGALAGKTRELDCLATGPSLIVGWRQRWADLVNAKLAERGLAVRIDHRSHAQRGLEDLPTIKEGWGANAKDRIAHNAATRQANREVREAQQQIQAWRGEVGTARAHQERS